MNDDPYRVRPADVYRETGQWIGPVIAVALSILGVFKICPSQGEPIHADDSLTNPQQVVGNNVAVGQMDPNGTYAGPNSGTYVLCVTKSGTQKMAYWEGDVFTESGTAIWNPDGGPGDQIQDIGPSALPVCVKRVAQDGDGLNLAAGTEYVHCELAK